MNDKLKISLLVDTYRYPITIPREDEQLYRDAAKLIDNKLNRYRTAYPELDANKHWAMAALDIAFENMTLKDRVDTRPFIEKLKEWENDLDELLGKPTGDATAT